MNIASPFVATSVRVFHQLTPDSHTLHLPLYSAIPIIICRFILNLRQVKPPGNSWASSGDQTLSLRYAGEMGGSLHFSTDKESEDIDAPIAQDEESSDLEVLAATAVEERSEHDMTIEWVSHVS